MASSPILDTEEIIASLKRWVFSYLQKGIPCGIPTCFKFYVTDLLDYIGFMAGFAWIYPMQNNNDSKRFIEFTVKEVSGICVWQGGQHIAPSETPQPSKRNLKNKFS